MTPDVREAIEAIRESPEEARKAVQVLYTLKEFQIGLNDEDDEFEQEYPRHYAMLRDMNTLVQALDKYIGKESYLNYNEVKHIREIVDKMRLVFVRRGFPWVDVSASKALQPTSFLASPSAEKLMGRQICGKAALRKHWEGTFGDGAEVIATIIGFQSSTDTYWIRVVPKTPDPKRPATSMTIPDVKRDSFDLIPEDSAAKGMVS